jgi:hypothetical protein
MCAKRAAVSDELNRIRTARVGKDTLEQLLRRPEQRYRDLPVNEMTSRKRSSNRSK